jgi:hypothetical protein
MRSDWGEVEQFGILRLATDPAVMHDKVARNTLRKFDAKVVLDQRESEINARCDAGGGPQLTIVDVDPVGFDVHVWKLPLQTDCVGPMRGCTPTP